MQMPSAIGLYFLAYLLLGLPWLARKSARQFSRMPASDGGVTVLPSRTVVFRNTLLMMLLLGALAWLAGRDFGYRFFLLERVGVREVLAGLSAMVLNIGFFILSRRWRTEEERRKLVIWRLVPRTQAEWVWASLVILAAGVVEEIAYRGVAMSVIWWATGSPWIAVLLCALAFAGAHAIQGGRSMLIVFGMALVAHGLVAVTGTLVVAMVVHVVYDLGAIIATLRKAEMYALAAGP